MDKLALLEKAESEVAVGNYSEALQIFDQLVALSDHPEDIANINLFKARTLRFSGDLPGAAGALQKITSLNIQNDTINLSSEIERVCLERVKNNNQAALAMIENIFTDYGRWLAGNHDPNFLEVLQTEKGILLARRGRL